jgi:hypothetical protein
VISGGLASKQIAVRLHLSPRTVEKHVASLLRETGARSRTAWWRRITGRSPRPSAGVFFLGHHVVPAGIYVLFPM